TCGKEPSFQRGLWQRRTWAPSGLFAEFRATADRLDGYGFDDNLFCAIDEAETRLVCFFERALHCGAAAGRHHERGIGAGVTNMRAHEDLDLAGRDTLARDFFFGRFSEQFPDARDRLEGLAAERQLDGLLARGADVGEAHAVGR